ncbi:hypothetical protein E2C01_021854 [Portunus trituberculatus]|uniref:Uncharacterized protein n=1 Tax=Portunus trituberculatus TaxID=210409 RepID=A0A5B7E5R1_PORTR|nr:hypothetical protein [Portunus trituberculatus]
MLKYQKRLRARICHTSASRSAYQITKLIHLEREGDEAVLKFLVMIVDEFLVLLEHRLAVLLLLAASVLLAELYLFSDGSEEVAFRGIRLQK